MLTLTQCPQCDLPWPDGLATCPNCNFPLKEYANALGVTVYKAEVPGGMGRIVQVAAEGHKDLYRITLRINFKRPQNAIGVLLRPVAYFDTYEEARQVLEEYVSIPYYVFDKDITVEEFYDHWFHWYSKSILADEVAKQWEYRWNFAKPLYKYKITDIYPSHIKACIRQADLSLPEKKKFKSAFNFMFDHAELCGIVQWNTTRLFGFYAIFSDRSDRRKQP